MKFILSLARLSPLLRICDALVVGSICPQEDSRSIIEALNTEVGFMLLSLVVGRSACYVSHGHFAILVTRPNSFPVLWKRSLVARIEITILAPKGQPRVEFFSVPGSLSEPVLCRRSAYAPL